MQPFQRGLIRIVKGPTGGFLASLGIAAILGGVALASPAPPIAAVADHPTEAVVAAPLGEDATGGSAASPVASGGVRTEDDPSGRGPAIDPGTGGNGSGRPGGSSGSATPGDPSGGGPSTGNGSAGGSPALGGGRHEPSIGQGQAHEGHHGSASGSDGNQGDDPSGRDQKPTTGPDTDPREHRDGDRGSGGTGPADRGSGDKGAGDDGSSGKPGGDGSGDMSH